MNMKIAYCILGTFNSGGMERVLCNKANWLSEKAGYEVSIITTDQKGRSPFFDFSPRIGHYDLGINYCDLPEKGVLQKIGGYLRKQRLHKARLAVLLAELKADVVISMFGTEVGFLPKMKDGSRKVAEIHFSKYFRVQQARGGWRRATDKWRSMRDPKLIRSYDKFVVLTREDKAYWGAHPNTEVIHNASAFVPSLQAELENKRVISVGRLTYQKGYDLLIDAWKLVNARYPDWKLTIVGGGEETEQRRAQIKALGLESAVELMPPTKSIEKEYLDSSIYVLSSRYEGLPMVLLEAMACGVPAVAFACKCGPRDVITPGKDGILVEQGDVGGLARGLIRLMENKDLRVRMGRQAAETVREKFNEQRIMGQWMDLFSGLCRQGRDNRSINAGG